MKSNHGDMAETSKKEINPAFNHLTSFIESVPSRFETEGESIYKARNEIKVFETEGVMLNVKSYRVPIWMNRVAYSFFRPTKASRAYHYAFELIRCGFQTPTPIAYIEIYRNGLLTHSYFISLHTPLDGNMRLFNDEDKSNEGKEALMRAFAQYTASLHEKGVLHIDYSPGNILFRREADEQFSFSLIDINRMKFQSVGMEQGCRNFCRMRGNDDFFSTVAREYAKCRGFDEEMCVALTLQAKREDREKRVRKERWKRRFRKN